MTTDEVIVALLQRVQQLEQFAIQTNNILRTLDQAVGIHNSDIKKLADGNKAMLYAGGNQALLDEVARIWGGQPPPPPKNGLERAVDMAKDVPSSKNPYEENR